MRISLLHLFISLLGSSAVTGLQTGLGRRDAMRTLVGAVAGVDVLSNVKPAIALEDAGFQAYRVNPDPSAALDPSLTSLKSESFLKEVASMKGGAVWLGEHHNSVRDHNLQATLLKEIRQLRGPDVPLAVGLEQVQLQFQPVLDDFCAGRIDMQQMREGVEWDKRWTWPFANYEPIFAEARKSQIALVALNVNSEDLTMVEKGGLPGLGRERLKLYISDGDGFSDFAKPRQFMTYVNYVIRPSYDLHDQMGLLRYSMSGEKLDEKVSFRNFYSGRILWDEAMANAAIDWTKRNRGGILVGLVGADHVKFKNGIPGRYKRMAGDTGLGCSSVLLNPTLIDTRPPGSVSMIPGSDSSQYPDKLTLQLRFLKEEVDSTSSSAELSQSTGGVMPLADFLLIG